MLEWMRETLTPRTNTLPRARARHAPRSLRIRIATEARSIARIGSKRKVLNVIRELEKQGIARKGLSANRHPWRWTSWAISHKR